MRFWVGEEAFKTRVKLGGALDEFWCGLGGVLDQGEGEWGFGWVNKRFRPG
jgi:hypothetical protein